MLNSLESRVSARPSETVARYAPGLADPKLKARFADLGGTVLPGSPADFGKLLMQEVDKWSKVVKASGAKPE